MNYLLLMTFAGSLLFLGDLCWDRLCRESLTQGMRYRALVMVLLVYAIPWVWLRRIYCGIPVSRVQELKGIDVVGTVNLANIDAETAAYRTEDYHFLLLMLGVWLTGAFLFLVVRLFLYFHSKRKLLAAAERCRNEIPKKTIERYKEKFHYKRNVKIYQVPENTTLTLGVIKPIIFLQDGYADEDLKFILGHEMVHITRGDLLIKLLLELVCCLHWFNPLIYFLMKRFDFVCETSCDERVLVGCTKEERGAFARLLVRSSTDSKRKVMLGSAFENSYKNVEGRVKVIMNTKEIKRQGKWIAAGCFALMLFVNSLTALAYPDISQVEEATIEAAEHAVVGDNFWGYDEYTAAEDAFDFSNYVILYDEQFVDEEGNIYPAGADSPQVICLNHNVVSGYFSTHLKDDDGGCTTYVYESTRCTKCHTIWLGDLYAIHTYTKCPHNP